MFGADPNVILEVSVKFAVSLKIVGPPRIVVFPGATVKFSLTRVLFTISTVSVVVSLPPI